MSTPTIPKHFLWRRLHSFTGVWFTLFLIEHLLTNSQAALFVGDDGSGFIHAVNWIKSLPYLPIIEITFLGVPILIHMVYGIRYLWTSKMNSFNTDGTKPSLPNYSRNWAYSFQRITSWILLVGVIAHVVHMRFIEYPVFAERGPNDYYMVRLDFDKGLYTLSERLDVQLYDAKRVRIEKSKLLGVDAELAAAGTSWEAFVRSVRWMFLKPKVREDVEEQSRDLLKKQEIEENREWITALESWHLKKGQVVAISENFGTAVLLMVRETFKIPLMIALYAIFVMAACYHGFNGLWTFMITWGVTLSSASQRWMRHVATFLIIVIGFLGLAACFGTYWINLRY